MDRLKSIANLDNLAVVLHQKDDIRLEQWPIQEKLGPHGQYFSVLNVWSVFL